MNERDIVVGLKSEVDWNSGQIECFGYSEVIRKEKDRNLLILNISSILEFIGHDSICVIKILITKMFDAYST